MLDVHPPHAPTHTWKDFFIHIATIVIGLLIAVGLEQTVEGLVHRQERRELIEAMQAQAERSLPVLQSDIYGASNQLIWLRAVIDLLTQAPVVGGFISVHLPPNSLGAPSREPSRAVWLIAKAKGTAALLPDNLAEVYDRLEYDAENTDDAVNGTSAPLQAEEALEARLHLSLSPDSSLRLTPAQRDEAVLVLSNGYAALDRVIRNSQKWAASTDAVVHKVQSRAGMEPYLARAFSY